MDQNLQSLTLGHGLSVLINDLKRKKGNFLLTGQKIDKTLLSVSSKTI